MTTRTDPQLQDINVGADVSVRFQKMEVVFTGVAGGAAAIDSTVFSGDGYTVSTVGMTPSSLMADQYPVLERIWDNEEDDRAFSSL